ncbi:MAG: RES family NAD+ phosphorylase [Alphaproteobacteria bacterium]
MELTIPVARVEWRPCHRIIPSRFPPIALFERIADPADYDALIALETMTNPRWREEVGEIALVPPEDRIAGPGSSVIMAAFTHPNPAGSRFSDGSLGVFYAAHAIETAIAETRHHRERFMRATRQGRMELDMRVYRVNLDAALHDIRGRQEALAPVYRADDHGASQQLARRLRGAGADGIVYDSVRHPGGECAAVFRPRLLSNCRQERHLCYVWNGERIETVYEKRSFPA